MHIEEGALAAHALTMGPIAEETLSPALLAAARDAGRAEARAILCGVADELEQILRMISQEPRASAPGPGVVLSALRTAASRLG